MSSGICHASRMHIEGLGRLSLVNLPLCRCCDTSEFGRGKLETLFQAFAQFIAGTPSLTYIWPCLGACHANFALALSDSTQPPADAVPAWLTVESANGTRSASRTPLRKHPQADGRSGFCHRRDKIVLGEPWLLQHCQGCSEAMPFLFQRVLSPFG